MHLGYRVKAIFFLGLLCNGCFASDAQIRISPRQPSKTTLQSGLAGTWVLKSIDLATGATLTPGMQTNLDNTRLVIEGDANGKISREATYLYSETGKPTLTCPVVAVVPFTVVHSQGYNFLKIGPGVSTPSPKCSPYSTQSEPLPVDSFMFDLSGDTLTTFDFGGGDGVLINTYAGRSPGRFNSKILSAGRQNSVSKPKTITDFKTYEARPLMNHRLSVTLFAGVIFSIMPSAKAQFGNSAAVQQAAPHTLAGTWILKDITVVNGTPLTPAMRAALQSTRITIEGDMAGQVLTQGVSTWADPGKPVFTCQSVSTANFTTAVIRSRTFLRLAPGPQTAGRDCGPYAGLKRTYPALNFMYDLAGDTFRTFEFAQDGAVIYTYARGQYVSAPARH